MLRQELQSAARGSESRADRLAKPSRTPLSIVIPTLNEERFLPQLLESLVRTGTRPLDIIVVDGYSDDATCDVVERYCRSLPAHVALRLMGSQVRNVSLQRNQGAGAARHETILFLDADTLIRRTADLDALVDGFRRSRLAAASCRFRPIERDLRAEAYYALLYCFHRVMERWDPYAMGACIITTREVFRYSGGFDPRLHVNEDANFCRKAACLGPFRILPVCIRVSARRFRRHGYLRMGFRYLRIFVERRLRGEAYDQRHSYEYGHYD
jgi:glycosyltransferase involved in cell wall biosynthesis